MGDSEDDIDYKRRDKFRNERGGGRDSWGSSGGHAPPPRAGPGSGWGGGSSSRSSSSRGYDDRGYGSSSSRHDRGYSPSRSRPHYDMSPPQKRMRGERDEYGRDNYGGGYRDDHYDRPRSHSYHRGGGGPSHYAPHHAGGRGGGHHGQPRGGDVAANDDSVQPPMMTFKAFLASQDDSISDDDAIKKYAEYKIEFKRQQLNEFFVHHKEEEWFKLKYHPEDSVKRREEQKENLMKRIAVFQDFFDNKVFAELSADADQSDKLVKLLDKVVILLEGGNENDFHILDELEKPLSSETDKKEENGEKKDGEDAEKKKDDADPNLDKAKSYLEGEKPAAGGDEDKAKGKKRKRSFGDGSGSSGSEDDEEAPPGKDKEEKKDGEEEEKPKTEENNSEEKKMETNENEVKPEENGEKKAEDGDKPRALHRTSSIFLRNLAPTITKQEVEAMCKKYPGFLRAAIADPQPERRWFRRGWVTFERNAKIKDICYNLNNIRLRDCELGPIVNRDLTRRIRTVSGLTVDKKVVRNDIKLASKVITNLDKKWNLWEKKEANGSSGATNGNSDDLLGVTSSNPVLKNITEYLIEEASAEEEELLGKNNDLEDGEEGEEGNSLVRDAELIQVLDRMLFYLRVVHSVDFYNHSEYPNEDEMPNRCGIMHARGIPPPKATPQEIEDYCALFEKKMGSFLVPKANLTEEECQKLGMKNEEDEVEKFVQANTQELGKDKWLCPISGKKFKGPDFVRKHIFNKHAEKVEEVKKEVQYYNRYLKDPKRPQLPENPQNRSGGAPRDRYSAGGHPPPRHGDPYQYSGNPREPTNYPVYDNHRGGGRPSGGGYYDRQSGGGYDRGGYPPQRREYNAPPAQRGGRYDGGAGGGRPIITYRDLDAPRDDEF